MDHEALAAMHTNAQADEFAAMVKDAERWRKFCSLDADVYINTHGWSFAGKGFGEQLARHLDLMESNQGEVK